MKRHLLALTAVGMIGCSGTIYNRVRAAQEITTMLEKPILSLDDAVTLFPKTMAEVDCFATVAIEKAQMRLEQLLAIKPTDRTFENTAQAFDDLSGKLSEVTELISLLEMVHPDKEMRDDCQRNSLRMRAFAVDAFTSKDLYKAFTDYLANKGAYEVISDSDRYFLQETMRDFKHMGLQLPDDQLEEVKILQKKLNDVGTVFATNIAEDKSNILATNDDLAGLDDAFKKALKQADDGRYIVGCDDPTYTEVIKHCSVEETRKRMAAAYANRAVPANLDMLNRIIATRDQLAKKLGFASGAELEIDGNMAENPERVRAFLEDLLARARSKGDQELEALKQELPDGVTLDDQGRLKPWDVTYLKESYKKKYFDIDDRKVAEYFPVESALQGVFDIYQKFLNLRFELMKPSWSWDDDVRTIGVHAKETDELLGYVFVDLYPRPGKYTHACCGGIVHPLIRTQQDGSVQRRPAVAMVIANFPKAREGNPALLKHRDVETFFHEFGHAMHFVLGATKLMSQSGYAVKFDFVEMPSQIFEEWMFDHDLLKNLSRHYKTGAQMPDDLITKIIDLKKFDSGFFVLRQAALSLLSLECFGPGVDKNIDAIRESIWQRATPQVAPHPGTHFQASFGHLSGYGSRYYVYMWSKVYALDVFAQLRPQGLLSPAAGKVFIDKILGRGGTVDQNVMLRDFLGREPRIDAFLEDLGMKATQ